MSRLQEQLQAIRQEEASHSILGVSQCSVLFPTDVAKQVSWSELAALARNGLYQLSKFDDRFKTFDESELFHSKYVLQGETVLADLDRGLQANATETETHALIQRFCLLLVPYFTTKPGQKCVEWLLRAHAAGALEPETLVTAALPYVSTEAFQRLVAALRLPYNASAKARWHWLDRVHSLGDLVEQTAGLSWFFPFLLDTAGQLLRAHVAASAWHRFVLRYGCAVIREHRETAGRVYRLLTTVFQQCGQVSRRDRSLWQEYWYACLGVLIEASCAMESIRTDLFLMSVKAIVRLYVHTLTWFPEDPSWSRRLLGALALLYGRHPRHPFPLESYEVLAPCEDWYKALAALDTMISENLILAYGMVAIDAALVNSVGISSWHSILSHCQMNRSRLRAFLERILWHYERHADDAHTALPSSNNGSPYLARRSDTDQGAAYGQISGIQIEACGAKTNAERLGDDETNYTGVSPSTNITISPSVAHFHSSARIQYTGHLQSADEVDAPGAFGPSDSPAERDSSGGGNGPEIQPPKCGQVSGASAEGAAHSIDFGRSENAASPQVIAKASLEHSQRLRERTAAIVRPCMELAGMLQSAVAPTLFWEVVYALERHWGHHAWWQPLWLELGATHTCCSSLLHPDRRLRSEAVRRLDQATPSEREQSLDLVIELLKRPDGFDESLLAELACSEASSLHWLRNRLAEIDAATLEPILPRHTLLYLRAKGALPARALIAAYTASFRMGGSIRQTASNDPNAEHTTQMHRVLETAYLQLCEHWQLPNETIAERAKRRSLPCTDWFIALGNRLVQYHGTSSLQTLLCELMDEMRACSGLAQQAASVTLALVTEHVGVIAVELVWHILEVSIDALSNQDWARRASLVVQRLNETDKQVKSTASSKDLVRPIRQVLETARAMLGNAPCSDAMNLLAEVIMWMAIHSRYLECQAIHWVTTADSSARALLPFLADAGVDAARWLLAPSKITEQDAGSCLALIDEFLLALGITPAAMLLEGVAAISSTCHPSSPLRTQRRHVATRIIQQALGSEATGPTWTQWRKRHEEQDIGRLLAACVQLLEPLQRSDWLFLQPLWALPASIGLAVAQVLLPLLRCAIEDASVHPDIPKELAPAILAACPWLCAHASLGPALHIPVGWFKGLLSIPNWPREKIDRHLLEAAELQRINWHGQESSALEATRERLDTSSSERNTWITFFQGQVVKAWGDARDPDLLRCLLSIARDDATTRGALSPEQLVEFVSAPLDGEPGTPNWYRCREQAGKLLIQCLVDASDAGKPLSIQEMETVLRGCWKRCGQLPDDECQNFVGAVVEALTAYARKTASESMTIWPLVYSSASNELPSNKVHELLKRIVHRDVDTMPPLVNYLTVMRRREKRTISGVQSRPLVAHAAGASFTKEPSPATLDQLSVELLQQAQDSSPAAVRKALAEAAAPLLQLAPRYLNLGRIFGNDSAADVVCILEHPHLPVNLLDELVRNVWHLETIREAIEKQPHWVAVSILLDHLDQLARKRSAQQKKNRRHHLIETLRVLGRLLLAHDAEPELLRQWLRNPLTRVAGLEFLPRLAVLEEPNCIAACIRTFSLQMVPFLPQALRLWPAPAVVQAMLETLPTFVSAALIGRLWPVMRVHFPDDRESEAMRVLLVESVPDVSLLEALRALTRTERCWGASSAGSEALRCLATVLSSWKPQSIQRHQDQLLSVIWQAMQTREHLIQTNGSELSSDQETELDTAETLSIDAFLAMALQLPEADFAEALYHSMLWSRVPETPNDDSPMPHSPAVDPDTLPRKRPCFSSAAETEPALIAPTAASPNRRLLVWFRLIRALAERLDTLFQKHVELVWDQVLIGAQQHDPETTASGDVQTYLQRMRRAALDALHACLAVTRDTCLSHATGDACLGIVSRWLSASAPTMITDEDVSALERLVAVIAQRATRDARTSHGTDTSSLLQRLHRLLTRPSTVTERNRDRHLQARSSRMRARLLRVLVETLSEAFLPLLPSTLPWLAEALESTDERIELIALDIGHRLSRIAGEDILAQLRDTPAV
jgi:hypothetical protein